MGAPHHNRITWENLARLAAGGLAKSADEFYNDS
jgi:hypothetical protein